MRAFVYEQLNNSSKKSFSFYLPFILTIIATSNFIVTKVTVLSFNSFIHFFPQLSSTLLSFFYTKTYTFAYTHIYTYKHTIVNSFFVFLVAVVTFVVAVVVAAATTTVVTAVSFAIATNKV